MFTCSNLLALKIEIKLSIISLIIGKKKKKRKQLKILPGIQLMNTLFLYSKEDCLFDLELLHVKIFSLKKQTNKTKPYISSISKQFEELMKQNSS